MNSVFIVGGSAVFLLIVYLGYGAWLGERWGINPKRRTPASTMEDGDEYVSTSAPVAAGQQLSSMVSLGTIQGTVLAAVFGWVPVLLWLVVGGTFFGATQNMGALFASVRNKGRSMGAMISEIMGSRSGKCFLLLSWLCLVFMCGVLLKLGSSQISGITTGTEGETIQSVYNGAVAMTVMLMIPVSILFAYLNRMHCPLLVSSVLALILMTGAVTVGVLFPMYLPQEIWIMVLLVYLIVQSALPVWFLTQPRAYLGSLLIYLLLAVTVVGIFVAHPDMNIPAFTGWEFERAYLFPYLFVVMAPIVLSGIQSNFAAGFGGTQLNNERNIKAAGFGPTLWQCFLGVAVLASVGSIPGEDVLNQYETPMDAFLSALIGFSQALKLDQRWELLARILLLFVFATIVLTSLDACARMGRRVLANLFENSRKQTILENSLVTSLITAAASYGMYRLGADQLWNLFGIYLALLSVPCCIAIMVWLKQIGQKGVSLILPLVGAGVVYLGGGFFQCRKDFEVILEDGISVHTAWELTRLVLLLLSVIAMGFFIMDGVRAKMKKRKIVFATGNQGKLIEIREIMRNLDAEILSLKEAGVKVDIVEDGSTFEENAIIKAKTISELTGCLVLADDSGLEVDYLDKEPGVLSARYMGEETSYHIKNQNLIDRLEGVEEEKRTARFVCVIAAVFPDGTTLTTRGTMEGIIGYEEKGENGFGYDPIFYLPEYKCSSAELSMDEKNKISHRGKALRAMKDKLV